MKLPEDAKIHDVFHVSLLKPFKRDNYELSIHIPIPFELEDEQKQPVAICVVRTPDIEGEQVQQVLIQWSGQKLDKVTWENWGEI